MIKISIIIPAYNVGMYLEETLESITNQNFEDYEIIVINDGSTDNTDKIIKKWEKKNPKIKSYYQKNKGLSYTRKVGLDLSIGEYIYFCDGDDKITPGALKFMYENAKNDSLDILMCNAEYKNELVNNSYGTQKDKTLVVLQDYSGVIMTGEELLEKMLINREWRYAVWLYLVKRELLGDVHFFKNFIHEDSAHNYQTLNLAKKVKYINRTVYIYRLREGSIMSSKYSIKNIEGYINSFNLIYEYNQNNYFNDITKYKFELRILKQIIDVYEKLDKTAKKMATKYLMTLNLKLHEREYYGDEKIQNLFSEGEIDLRAKNRYDIKNYLEYLELHVVEHCNLNCENCCHYAPLAPEKYLNVQKYKKNMTNLSKLINKKLKRLVLMGGEPLLHPQIIDIIKITKNIFPFTDIQLLTNGILLNKMSNEFWETCKKMDIQINISIYPINVDYEKIINKIKNLGIRYYLYGEGKQINYFDKYVFDPTGTQNKEDNFYYKCGMAKDCAYFNEGKIYPCQLSSNIVYYNKKAKVVLPQSSFDYIQVENVKFADEIYKFLSTPIPFCQYCDLDNTKKVLWKIQDK